MKKIVVICLALVLVFGASFSAFAAPGGFFDSPSKNKAPELVEGKTENEACEARIIVTAYGDRDELKESSRKDIEAAYASIVGTTNLNTLNSGLAILAEKKGMDVSKFAVSDLFDVSATECNTGHESHGKYHICLKHEELQDYVALLHYVGGQWQMIEYSIVTHDGECLEFETESLSPFALVVNTGDVIEPPVVDDGLSVGAIVAIVAGSLLALLLLLLLILTLIRRKSEEAI